MDSSSPTKGEIFEVKKGTVYLKQTESNHSIRVYLIHVIIIGQFYLHVSLSEYSVTKLRFLDRIFKLVIQVEDTCLIEKKITHLPTAIHSHIFCIRFIWTKLSL